MLDHQNAFRDGYREGLDWVQNGGERPLNPYRDADFELEEAWESGFQLAQEDS